uniref:Uncharacterized protein n=1 Tax=viral metagenome TaxID=1070528 RepID=A0A6C0E9W2_9ZZZZ
MEASLRSKIIQFFTEDEVQKEKYLVAFEKTAENIVVGQLHQAIIDGLIVCNVSISCIYASCSDKCRKIIEKVLQQINDGYSWYNIHLACGEDVPNKFIVTIYLNKLKSLLEVN